MAGPTVPQSLSRRRPAPTGDEEATSILKLGDMADTPTLSVAECNVLLTQLASAGGKRGGGASHSDVYTKTREYVAMFARFKDGKTVTQVDAISSELLKKGVSAFERAQLGELLWLAHIVRGWGGWVWV